ncbi:ParB N-terminal domain-containing protein [Ureibacillus chungkukjangi]|uniref:ParB N-terminal domain-containing protein n=1 Tax=Ureibacillus chungkukjangi TaxID=1202712 RepID=UPI00203ACE8C|nr:ParB N-terminal domain-containing protein [Ureibacillus chungkukjangi]MCM3386859.1 ParB N-terminal domain-containing protein [Ureibacillus chungkukjangi]
MFEQPKTIKLSQIRLETSYRKNEKDLSLEMDINRNGLIIPLIVQQESEDKYVLVDGYRRYYALVFLEKDSADCFVENYTSEEDRIIKRLRIEFHTKKRTGYQLEEMINRLLETELYDEKLIVSRCNVTVQTIAKYRDGAGVNPDWIRRGKQTGAGRQGLTIIHKLKLGEEVKNYIADRYINREFSEAVLKVIRKATQENAFIDLLEEDIKDCIDLIITLQLMQYEPVEEIVHEYRLHAVYALSSHAILYTKNTRMLTQLEEIYQIDHYVKNLSYEQKAELNEKVSNLYLEN